MKIKKILYRAEAETKLKLEKCQEIKKLNQQIMSIRSDMSKNEDLLKDYRRYRQCLESITPESWFEEQEKIYGHSIVIIINFFYIIYYFYYNFDIYNLNSNYYLIL